MPKRLVEPFVLLHCKMRRKRSDRKRASSGQVKDAGSLTHRRFADFPTCLPCCTFAIEPRCCMYGIADGQRSPERRTFLSLEQEPAPHFASTLRAMMMNESQRKAFRTRFCRGLWARRCQGSRLLPTYIYSPLEEYSLKGNVCNNHRSKDVRAVMKLTALSIL